MIFAVNKPIGPSSNAVLQKIRKAANTKRVGHAGTLDPLASGVLVVAVNRPSTKQLTSLIKKDKEYIAEITLGQISTTDDGEGEITNTDSNITPDEEIVKNVLQTFTGEIMQTPPIHSAIKINGKRAYKYARKGQEVKIEPRKAVIHEIELLNYAYPLLKIRVDCASGVYIRSLARDIGQALETGGYMSALERTRVGDFYIEDAYSVEEISSKNEDFFLENL